ncbi:uncharacterized protein [Diabrotica undecimpunctata]|uniref:uncharacterized protein n=1 Tax=Diabrotica undecimpunctata TaxID=50387 RepID=UPI003B63E248
MSEDKQNIIFVQIIKKYPCLYNFTRDDYSKRSATEKAWCAVSKETGISVTECEEKWKNLRTALKRAQNKLPSGSEAKKKNYYLHDVMLFLFPFLKSRPQSGYLHSPSRDNDNDVAEPPIELTETNTSTNNTDSTVIEEDNEDPPNTQDCEGGAVEHAERRKLPLRPKHFVHRLKKKNRVASVTSTLSDEADKSFIEYMKRQTNAEKPTSADLEFLQSLLPDVMQMDFRRKRRFKRSVLELIDNILAEQEGEQNLQFVGPTSSSASSQWSHDNSSNVSAAEYLATWNMQ